MVESAEAESDGWRASLVIVTDAWSSAKLIEAIGLPPDRAWDRGDDPTNGVGRGGRRSSGVAYSSMLADPATIECHLDDLLDRRASHREWIAAVVAALEALPNATVSIGVRLVVSAEADAQGIFVSRRQLRTIAALGADLGITVEFWGAVEEPAAFATATAGS